MTDKEAKDYKKLLEENLRLKNEIKNLKNSKTEDTSGWDFHYDGHGDYEEQRRCFYGNFS